MTGQEDDGGGKTAMAEQRNDAAGGEEKAVGFSALTSLNSGLQFNC